MLSIVLMTVWQGMKYPSYDHGFEVLIVIISIGILEFLIVIISIGISLSLHHYLLYV